MSSTLLTSFSSTRAARDDPLFVARHDRTAYKKFHIEKFGDDDIVFGLEWYRLERLSGRDIAEACATSRADLGVSLTADRELDPYYMLGAIANFGGLNRTLYAAASIVVERYPDPGIFLFEVGDGFWLMATVDGLPIIGKELFTRDERLLGDILDDLLYNYHQFEIITNSPSALPREFESAAQIIELESLIGDAFDRSVHKLRRVRGIYKPLLLLAVPVIFCLTLLWVYGDRLLGWVDVDAWIANWNLEARQAEYDHQIGDARSQLLGKFNQVAVHYPKFEWVRKVAFTLDRIPVTHQGWAMEQLVCRTGTPQCEITWKNLGFGTNAGLAARFEPLGELRFVSGDTATQMITLPDYATATFSDQDLDGLQSQLRSHDAFLIGELSRLQAVASISEVTFTVDINPRKAVKPPQAPAGVSAVDLPNFALQRWQMNGTGMVILLGLVEIINPDVFFADTLEIRMAQHGGLTDFAWRLGGYYVVLP